MNKEKLLLTSDKLINKSDKYTVKLDFSIESLIQVKRILHNKNISLKEFISFVFHIIEQNESYKEIFELLINEIINLKESDELVLIKSLTKDKKNIYSILESNNSFKNRKKSNNIIKEENEEFKNQKNNTNSL